MIGRLVDPEQVPIPKIREGVTQTDIEQYGVACFNFGKSVGRKELRDELKAERTSKAGLLREGLDLAAALRDGGVQEEQIIGAVIRVMLGRSE